MLFAFTTKFHHELRVIIRGMPTADGDTSLFALKIEELVQGCMLAQAYV